MCGTTDTWTDVSRDMSYFVRNGLVLWCHLSCAMLVRIIENVERCDTICVVLQFNVTARYRIWYAIMDVTFLGLVYVRRVVPP